MANGVFMDQDEFHVHDHAKKWLLVMIWTQESHHKSVNYVRPGGLSREKDCSVCSDIEWRLDNLGGSHHQSWLPVFDEVTILLLVCQL